MLRLFDRVPGLKFRYRHPDAVISVACNMSCNCALHARHAMHVTDFTMQCLPMRADVFYTSELV